MRCRHFCIFVSEAWQSCSLMRYRLFFSALYEQPRALCHALLTNIQNVCSGFLQRFILCEFFLTIYFCNALFCAQFFYYPFLQQFILRQFFLIAKINSQKSLHKNCLHIYFCISFFCIFSFVYVFEMTI